jgi:hypothetical protein
MTPDPKRIATVRLEADAAKTVDKIKGMGVHADTDEEAILWLLCNVTWTAKSGGGGGGGGTKQNKASEERYTRDLKPGTTDLRRKPEMGIAVPKPEQPTRNA